MERNAPRASIPAAALLAALLPATLLALPVAAQDAVTPGQLAADPTFQHVGLRWHLTGDADLDATCSVRYRRQGTATWLPALDLVRMHPGVTGEGGSRPDNRFAGSVFFLDTETAYEFELTIADPDGGGETRTIVAATPPEMAGPANPRDRFVVPGAGGGSGTAADPFLGLQSAANAAQPGDVFHVAAGTYGAFSLVISGAPGAPIVFRGPIDPTRHSDETAWAIVDGAGTQRSVIQLGDFSFDTTHVIFERLAIQDGLWGIDAQNTSHVTVRRNVFRNVGYGYYNRRDSGTESNQLISDNVFSGRNVWPDVGIPSERAIDLRGIENVIRYNRIHHFGDGASIQPYTGNVDAYSNDIHGNDISEIVDDPIEIDYNVANTRVWRNRVANARMGVSLAPIFGGPAYVFRNEFFNLESSAYKMNRSPSGLVVLHDTSAKQGNGTSSPSGWQNTFLRNNVLLGTRYVFEEFGLVPGSVDDWDFDALGTPATPFAKWDDIRYQDLSDLRANSGVEANAVPGDLLHLVNAPLPAAYTDGIAPGSYDLRLVPGVPAVNAGEPLPNVNDPFVTDGRPDIGAHELGSPLPQYGPRLKVLLDRADLGLLAASELPRHLQWRQDCAGGTPEASGAIGRTRIPADEATAVHELPDPVPLRLRGEAAWTGTNPLRFFEIEDAAGAACTSGSELRVRKDVDRVPADLVFTWR